MQNDVRDEHDRYRQTLELLADTASSERDRRVAQRVLDGLPIAGKVTDADLARAAEIVSRDFS